MIAITLAGVILNTVSAGNYVLTAIGCFVLSIFLNRPSKSSTTGKAASTTVLPTIQKVVSQGKGYLSPPTRSQKPPSRQPSSLTCRKCGAVLTPGKRFCINCGIETQLVSRQSSAQRCQKCGATLKPGKRFCTNCGSESKPARVYHSARAPQERKWSPETVKARMEALGDQDEKTYYDLIRDIVMIDDWGRYWSLGAQDAKWYLYEKGSWTRDHPVGSMRIRGRSGTALVDRFLSDIGLDSSATYGGSGSICPYCGRRVSELDSFCTECGRSLGKSDRQLRPA